ncbi:uncharacterized protein VNE69_09030 [Vairimorpha necatrix]|uniref:Uncharacterized protein n=1 Tax=Vairimorpha necatrix TaxID=6039 RepID=A0AAX4JEP1_9MICR
MIHILEFLRCTTLTYNEYIDEDVNMLNSEDYLSAENAYNFIYNENSIEKSALKNFECSESTNIDDDLSFVVNDVFFGQKLETEFMKQNHTNCANVLDTDTQYLDEKYVWNMNTDQSLEDNNLANVGKLTSNSASLNECINKIKNFIAQRKNESSNIHSFSDVYIHNSQKEIVIKNHNLITHFFLNVFINKFNNEYIPRISMLIYGIDITEEIKDIILEFINVFKFFLTVYDNKIIERNDLNTESNLKIISYNIKIMNFLENILIIDCLKKIEDDLMLKEYKNDVIK